MTDKKDPYVKFGNKKFELRVVEASRSWHHEDEGGYDELSCMRDNAGEA